MIPRLALITILACPAAFAATGPLSPDGALEPNLGQLHADVAYTGQLHGVRLFITQDGRLVHQVPAHDDGSWVLVERLENAAPLQPRTLEPSTAQVRWIDADVTREAALAQRVALGEPWPGIRADLVATARGYDKQFHLSPGTSAKSIGIHIDGADGLTPTRDGRLRVRTEGAALELSAPYAWQTVAGREIPVTVRYRVLDAQRYGFVLGAHDPAHAVTIDPILRTTYVGGKSEEGIDHLATGDDSIYITGYTRSADFPGTSGGYQSAIIRNTSMGGNVYIARYSLDLTTLLQATYFGNFGPVPNNTTNSGITSRTLAITADSVYVAGTAPGSGTHLPGTAGGFQTAPAGGNGDAWIARFSRDLTSLQQATYFGGSGDDSAWPMVVGPDGVYISGVSNSSDLPGLANGAVGTLPGGMTAAGAPYIAKLALDLRSVVASSWVGDGVLSPRAMTRGPDGSIYTGGDGFGTLLDTSGAFQPVRPSINTTYDGFIVRMSPALDILYPSTYLGGSGSERIDGLAATDLGVYATGTTASSNFPVAPDAAKPNAGAGDGFVALLSPDLTTRLGATFYGGTNGSVSLAGVVTLDSEVLIAGTTTSSGLPMTAGAMQSSNPTGGICGFAARFSETLNQIRQSTYVACGGNIVQVYGLATAADTLYVAGRTQSLTLPGTDGAAQPVRAGNYDAFILAVSGDLAGPRPTADLAVTKTGSTRRVLGRWIQYTVTVENLGPDNAEDARIQDLLPPETDAANWRCTAAAGASCPQANGTGSIDAVTTLPVGGRLTFELCARTPHWPALVINTAEATVAAHTLDPVAANDHDSAVTEDPSLFSDGFEDLHTPAGCPALP